MTTPHEIGVADRRDLLAAGMQSSVELESQVGKGMTAIPTLAMPTANPKDLPERDPRPIAAAGPAPAPRRPAPSIADAEAEETLVLVAKGHPIDGTILKGQLGTLGYAAEVAENGLDALEQWRTGRFALLIADCHMPLMDGYELARSIRRLEAETGQARRPVIACTANALRGDAEACFAAVMDDYLPKPVAVHALAMKLNRWLPLPAIPAATGSGEEPEAPAAPATASPLDPQALTAVVGHDSKAQQRILARFRDSHRQDVDRLAQAFEDGDLSEVARWAHRIRGASRTIGAMDLGALCEQIESAARSGDRAQANRLRPELLRESARLKTFLSELPG